MIACNHGNDICTLCYHDSGTLMIDRTKYIFDSNTVHILVQYI